MRLDHPNVVKIYQVLDSETECYVVMEYAPGGELMSKITKNTKFSEDEARKYFRQLISAIDHFHQAKVVHRDLKLENILLTENMDLLITDFGLGRTFTTDYEDIMQVEILT
jgi:serine/threonine protein kinase